MGVTLFKTPTNFWESKPLPHVFSQELISSGVIIFKNNHLPFLTVNDFSRPSPIHELINYTIMNQYNDYSLVSMDDNQMEAFILSNQITQLIAEGRTDNFQAMKKLHYMVQALSPDKTHNSTRLTKQMKVAIIQGWLEEELILSQCTKAVKAQVL